jgi:hypothetical protein
MEILQLPPALEDLISDLTDAYGNPLFDSHLRAYGLAPLVATYDIETINFIAEQLHELLQPRFKRSYFLDKVGRIPLFTCRRCDGLMTDRPIAPKTCPHCQAFDYRAGRIHCRNCDARYIRRQRGPEPKTCQQCGKSWETMEISASPIPKTAKYSILISMPGQLRATLHAAATREGLSINRYVVALLTTHLAGPPL